MALNDVIFEFFRSGNAVKVTALDTETLVEVSIVGPAGASEASLKAVALSKLKYVIAKSEPDKT